MEDFTQSDNKETWAALYGSTAVLGFVGNVAYIYFWKRYTDWREPRHFLLLNQAVSFTKSMLEIGLNMLHCRWQTSWSVYLGYLLKSTPFCWETLGFSKVFSATSIRHSNSFTCP